MMKHKKYILWLIIAFYILNLKAEGTIPKDFPHLSITFDEQNKTITSTLQNNTDHDITFVDHFHNKINHNNTFLSIMIKDNNSSKIITKSDYSEDGYINNTFLINHTIDVPATMLTLHPHEIISKTIYIPKIIGGTFQYWTIPPEKLKKFSIKIENKIFLDPYLNKSSNTETDWFNLTNNSIFYDGPVVPTPPKMNTPEEVLKYMEQQQKK